VWKGKELKIMENNFDYEKAVKEIVADSMDDIKSALKEQVKKNIVDGLYYTVREKVSEEVKKFMDSDEIKQAITAELNAAKPVIIKSVQDASIGIGAKIAETMTETFTKNMGYTYKIGNLVKAMFE
jgi:methionine synthase I (cobalamin-dependent)